MKLYSQAELEALSAEEYRKRFKEQPAPKLANVEPLIELRDDTLLIFRGRVYRSPPTSWHNALLLMEIGAQQADLAERASEDPMEVMRGIARIQKNAIRLFRRLCRPIDWRRFIYPILPNPFRNASPREVDHLLDFFYQHQTRSTVQTPSRTARAARRN